MNNITQGLLAAGHHVKVLSIETMKHPSRETDYPKGYQEKTGIETVFVDTTVNVIDAFSNLVTQDSYNISRFFSPDFDIKLIQTLRQQEFDIIHLESLFMTPYIHSIRRHSKAKIVLRSHNLEYIIWERMASGSKNKAKKAYLSLLAKQLKKYEFGILDQLDGIAAITSADANRYKKIGCRKPMVTIPFGIDLKDYNFSPVNGEAMTLFHLGSMDWKPNQEGVKWLLKKVWPIVLKQSPDARMVLAGRNMPDWLTGYQENGIQVIGEVESASEFMSENSIMLVPLLSAGGMRVKIIEGMALGKTIVSTQIGAEGIDCKDSHDIILADKPAQFANAITQLMEDRALCQQLGLNARKLVEQNYSNKALTYKLVRFYQDLIDSAH